MDDIAATPGPPAVVPLRRTAPAATARPSAAPGTGSPATASPGTASRGSESPEPLWRQLVGQVLRSERVETHRTLQQVAERAGVSAQYLSEVERGRKDPSSEMLESICGALGLRLADLLVESGRILRYPSPVARQLSTRAGLLTSRPVDVVSLAA